MINEMDTLDPITFLMEYGNIPYGSSANSFYKLGLFNRNIKKRMATNNRGKLCHCKEKIRMI